MTTTNPAGGTLTPLEEAKARLAESEARLAERKVELDEANAMTTSEQADIIAGTVAKVDEIPACGFACGQPAAYDAMTVFGGRWAYMCEAHYKAHRFFDVLGLGKGQRLVVWTDVERTQTYDQATGQVTG